MSMIAEIRETINKVLRNTEKQINKDLNENNEDLYAKAKLERYDEQLGKVDLIIEIKNPKEMHKNILIATTKCRMAFVEEHTKEIAELKEMIKETTIKAPKGKKEIAVYELLKETTALKWDIYECYTAKEILF